MREQLAATHPNADSVHGALPRYLDSFDPRIMSVGYIFPGSKERNIHTWERAATMVTVMHAAVQEARASNTPENTIDTRIQVVALSLNYAINAFFETDSSAPAGEVTGWIPDQLISTVSDKNPVASHIAQWLSDWVRNYAGDPKDIHTYLAESIRIERDAKEFYTSFVNRFPQALLPKKSAVSYWNPDDNPKEYIIGIDGYSRDGVKSLRKIVSDFQALRKKKFHTPLGIGKDHVVTSDSWMFGSQEKMELLFGESIEQLSVKGLRWSGPISINFFDNTDQRMVYPVNRIIGSAVYALQLRDPFMRNFIARDIYPIVGSFQMPRTTFQNYFESVGV